MFDKTITNSDEFIEMPMSSQVLYFHLSMNADDDGFINNWKSIMRMTGTKEDDLKVLIAKQFIIPFESGVIVIKHWRINNFLRKDRHIDTKFQKELSMLGTNDNQEYVWLTNGQPSIEKNSIEKNSIEKKKIYKERIEKLYFENNKVNDIFLEFLDLRKKIKAVNSDRAINTLINKLNKYDDDTKFMMIEQSIVNSWKDVYELKNKQSKKEDDKVEWF